MEFLFLITGWSPSLISQIDWADLMKTLGVPFAVVLLGFFIFMKWFTTMLPVWKDRAEAEVQLLKTLNEELPKISSGIKETFDQIKLMHERHDETQNMIRDKK